jgi:hypothetical protein
MKLRDFKKTKWYKPTLARYSAHLRVCNELECEELIVPFQKFIDEIIDAPTDECRADMLAIEDVEPYVAWQRYPAYIEPTKEEQKLDFYGVSMGRKLR